VLWIGLSTTIARCHYPKASTPSPGNSVIVRYDNDVSASIGAYPVEVADQRKRLLRRTARKR
jgi:hypothetical protein